RAPATTLTSLRPTVAEAAVGPAWTRVLAAATVVAASAHFVVLKLYSLHAVPGDEHLYFNMAVLVNQGLLPYRDFFYTHPPLHLYIAVGAFRLFGYSLVLGKLLPNLAMLVAGLLVFDLGRRTLGAIEGAVAYAIFLLAFDPLRISSHFTGANESFVFAIAGLWLAYVDRPTLAGIAFGLGVLVAVYVLPGVLAVAMVLWWRSRQRMVRFVAVAAAVTLAGNLLFYLLAGWGFGYQGYITQFLKGREGDLVGYTLLDRLGFILYENRLLTAGAPAGFVVLAFEVRARWLNARAARGRTALRAWTDQRGQAFLVFVAWFACFWIF